ncbi:hypothetical protein Pla175_47000 [Pirellulimonas nuda]|uniref:Uncharacterized protein n=1 Tax=Pirellulimonas nuda TaxID=2528009 RepID=A0A518DII3_9BACT|nr:hypothetical protein [Pirellulimonas nuda]QDU91279.1 hypothetical protein Pla175_47000 [Pirellulimonas nuda]
MHHCYLAPIALAAIVFAPAAARAQSIATVTGSLAGLVAELTGPKYFLRGPKSDPRPYVDPSPELPTLFRTARLLDSGAVDEAARLAEQAGYEVVRFVDQKSGKQYLLLREDLARVSQPRGWGAFLLNPDSQVPAIVEAPHPLDDSNSAKVAAMVFEHGAKGLLLAGAQRDKADVPDLIDSVFHQVHVAWTGPLGQVAAWQIHGFAIEKHPFPDDAKAILSTGGGEVTEQIVTLNDRLVQRGMAGYSFNNLKPKDELNQKVNEGTPGVRFSSLAATKNEQGRHLRSVGGAFVHVELERAVRSDAGQRRVAAEAIAEAIIETARPLGVSARPDPALQPRRTFKPERVREARTPHSAATTA